MKPFGPWLPDQYDYNSDAAGEALGVLPGPNSYVPWPSLAAFSLSLGEPCRGAFVARTIAGSYTIYAGTETKLYKFVGPGDAWTDVSKVGGYTLPDDEYWSFDQFGTTLVAVNANTVPQYIDVEAGTIFANLSGNPPQARYVKTVGDQLFLLGLNDNPNRIHWSGRNDISFWTPGSRDCDFQDFPDGGFVNGMTSLELGLVFQETSIRRIARTDTRAIFQFARIEDARGLKAPSSLVAQGAQAFYLSEDGFFVTNGAGASAPIGADQIDAWFQSEVNLDRLYAVVGASDPVRQRVFWLFPSTNNSTEILDRCLCYDVTKKRWTHAEFDASFILPVATPGYTLDTLDALGYTLDTLPFSLDARFLLGGAPFLAAFDSAYKLALFSGENQAATVETGSFQAIPGRRATIREVSPLTDTASATIQVGHADRPQGTISWGSAASLRSNGSAATRSTGLSHRIRVNVPEGTSWTHLQGVNFIPVMQGER